MCVNDTEKATLRVLRDWPLIRTLKRDASRKNVLMWHFDKNKKWAARMHDGKWFRSLKKIAFVRMREQLRQYLHVWLFAYALQVRLPCGQML